MSTHRPDWLPLKPNLLPYTGQAFFTGLMVVYFLFVAIMSGKFATLSGEDTIVWGANLFTFQRGEWWRLVTSNFLQPGILHLLLSGAAFFFAAGYLEKRVGTVLLIVTVLLTAIMGAGFSALMRPEVLSAGSHGLLFGMAGVALALMIPGAWRGLPVYVILGLAGFFLLLDFVNMMGLGADLWLDFGGFVTGLIWGGFLGMWSKKEPAPKPSAEPETQPEIIAEAESPAEVEDLQEAMPEEVAEALPLQEERRSDEMETLEEVVASFEEAKEAAELAEGEEGVKNEEQ